MATISAPAVIATSGSGPPASHATHAAPKTSTPFTTSGRSTPTGTVSSRSRNGSARSARNVQRRYPYVRARPPTATGSMRTRNPPNVVPLQMPTSMFCGLPVTESTEPTLAPIARPMRYGVGRTRSGPSAASSTGVTTRQIVSFTKNADNSPPPTTTPRSRRSGVRARRSTHSAAHSKNFPTSRYPTISMRPRRNTSTSKSMAAYASWRESTPPTTIATAPSRLAAGRFRWTNGSR